MDLKPFDALKGDPSNSNTTVIATGTRVTGDIQVDCKLHIDGELSGTILSSSLVTIGKTGRVDGEITACKLVVTGRFEGHADCDEVEILSGGRITGQVESNLLVIERGSAFSGESRLKEQKEVQKEVLREPQKEIVYERNDPPKNAFGDLRRTGELANLPPVVTKQNGGEPQGS
ncbi:MAG: polymer-forming cytoskeletal protein [Magnetococcales bacterium]|nr:polymer-forming cytoskeletal protein [Magnetococcales bacterium]